VVVTAVLAALGAAYVIGAVPVGYLVARAWGFGDIRGRGSGNIGTTNVLRTAGRGPAVLTLAGDVAKGAAAVIAAAHLGGGEPWAAAGGAVAAIAGNCWPVFLRFRGGKGVATGLGAYLALMPWATAPAVVVWAAIVGTFRFVSLGSVAAAACLPLGALLLGYGPPAAAAALAGAAIVIGRHRANLARLLAGAEPRMGERAGAPQ
jgi:acyl phosphate:glycerol-3-phosphate acyltransferase